MKIITKRYASLARSLSAALVLAVALLVPTQSALAQRDLKTIPVPDPAEELRSFEVAEGFEVNLYAADPLLAKPIQMNFDPQGRLWVASSEIYPHILPGQTANDKILILEDANGDGQADKTTVFADGLLIPTGVEPGDGGAYVANSTDLVHLRDTDGDGKADKRSIVLTGFGTEDTHHIVHTLRWGPDGMLYFNQSIYIHSHIETPHGVRRLNAGGIWQFRPETLQLEVFARGWYNSWGHHIDRFGQSFATDGAHSEGIVYVIPGAYYVASQGGSKILKGLNPGSPKHCGLEILSGRHLPDSWQGNMLTNDFRAHRVCRFVISDDGSGYASKEQPEVIKTKHVAFRPIDVKMGPDGAIYVADWYNPIIQHGEVDFRDPRRDHTHGRIWRITAKGRPLVSKPKLVDASVAELLESLKLPEGWTRQQAKRVLKERGAEKVLPVLDAWWPKISLEGDTASVAANEHLRLEALWTYQSLDVVNAELLKLLLAAKTPEVRAAAARVLGQWANRLPEASKLAETLVSDEHPRVRLEATRTLAMIPKAESAAVALKVLDKPRDRFLDYGLFLTLRELQSQWLPGLQADPTSLTGNAKHLQFALEAVGTREVVAPLMAMLKKPDLTREQEERALLLVASVGGVNELNVVLDMALDPASPGDRAARLLDTLVKNSGAKKQKPNKGLARLGKLLDAPDAKNPELQAAAARAVGNWMIEELEPRLVALAMADDTHHEVRGAALEALAKSKLGRHTIVVNNLAAAGKTEAIRIQALRVLVNMSSRDAASLAARQLIAMPATGDPSPIIEAFIRQGNSAVALQNELIKATLHPDVARLAIRSVRNSVSQDHSLIPILARAGKLESPRVFSPAEVSQLVADVLKLGDATRGESVYRRAEQGCQKCHAIGGAGGQVGPDLISIGASAQIDYLVESLLEPNKKIKEGYQSVIVVNDEGFMHHGIKLRETDTAVILRTIDDREVGIPLASIEVQKNGPSLMPLGVVDGLTRAELLDLVRFLSELGKVGPFSVSKTPLVRRWQAQAATGDTWSPAYSQVSGELPLADLPRRKNDAGTEVASVKFSLDVTTAGKVGLKLKNAAGLKVSIDGASARLDGEHLLADLGVGVHTVALEVDLARRADGAGLSVELQEVADSPARVQIVGGK